MELKTIDLGGGIGRVVLSAPIKNHEIECSDCGQPAIYRFFEIEKDWEPVKKEVKVIGKIKKEIR